METTTSPRGRRRLGPAIATALLLAGSTSCSLDGLLNKNEFPPNVSDPAVTKTPAGAMAAYNGVILQFGKAFAGSGGDSNTTAAGFNRNAFVPVTAWLTDELRGSAKSSDFTLDLRNLQEFPTSSPTQLYENLQKVRGDAAQAIGLLQTYVPDQPALLSRLYALQGYAEVFLAEVFCSGIPLSTLDYGGDYTYRPGSLTDEVFAHAVALFDTALALAGDSVRFAQLAQVGKGRALLARGLYADAATAVMGVPDQYSYAAIYTTTFRNFASIVNNIDWGGVTVMDREGVNGLDWGASGDPRTLLDSTDGSISDPNSTPIPVWYPRKYARDGSSPIVVASGVEARLIGAEAALQQGDAAAWLATLNALRTDGTFDVTATTPPDTLWHAGSGGVAGLAPLADPGTSTGRVDLLFRERAFWLFLTGHRQGDLRRLIRQYGRVQEHLYPIGIYDYVSSYGSDVTVPIPATEFANPLFTGCASRGA